MRQKIGGGVMALVVAICASASFATTVTYSIVPSESSLTISGASSASATFGGFPLTGSMTQSLQGAIQADVVAGQSIQFQGGAINAAGDFSGKFDTGFMGFFFGLDTSLKNFSMELGGDPISMNGSSFAAGSMAINASGTANYATTGLLGTLGKLVKLFGVDLGLEGSAAMSSMEMINRSGMGSLVSEGGIERLTIPVSIQFSTGYPNDNPILFTMTGTIVAQRNDSSGGNDSGREIPEAPEVPEPATLAMLALSSLLVARRQGR